MNKYKSREDAGEVLAKKLVDLNLEAPMLLAIPRGGIQIAVAVSQGLKIPMSPIITKKLPTPESPETGFGAISEDGHIVLNDEYFKYLNLSQEELDEISRKVVKEIRHRVGVYGSYDKEKISESEVIVVDDGAATGYSLIAALKNVKEYNPKKLIAAIPVSSKHAYEKINKYADVVVCPIVDSSTFFAVGYFYEEWFDLSEDEIVQVIERSKLNRD